MSHDHDHSHAVKLDRSSLNRAFIIGIILNAWFVIVEFLAWFFTNSLALLSDAGHNLSDVASLLLALFAFKVMQSKATAKFTYGYQKSTVLVSLVNASILLVTVGAIGWEAIRRFSEQQPIDGITISIVAGVGILINTISAFLFFRDKDKDLNVKGAYVHLAVDALVSLGVVVSGTIIYFTGYFWIDPVISIVIMLVVLYSTRWLLTESLRLSLDAVPKKIDQELIKELLLKNKDILDVHHIHIWALSTTKNAMTAHIVVSKDISSDELQKLKNHIKHELEHDDIQHVTLEIEHTLCKDQDCKE